MQCYDCVLESRATTVAVTLDPAIAVAACARCGAGICGGHLHVSGAPVTGHAGASAPAVEARRLTCGVCYAAERAAESRA
ncbi:hypothetical protein ABZ883_18310 [Streptomyces sp. NPDC046977]|uniref:hypothetical protein n=1 Tax=Streptomyces sp. NPDC046977 TaxID=3154703 RepID=UPI0033E3ADCF